MNTTLFVMDDSSEANYNWTAARATLRDDALYDADKAVAATIWLLWVLFLSWPVLLFVMPMLFMDLARHCSCFKDACLTPSDASRQLMPHASPMPHAS